MEQKLEIGAGRNLLELEAKFSQEKNQTLIRQEESRPESRVVKPGLALLRLVTDKGKLRFEY